jgi:hypothetical protein
MLRAYPSCGNCGLDEGDHLPFMMGELNVVGQRYRAVLDVLSGFPVAEFAVRLAD